MSSWGHGPARNRRRRPALRSSAGAIRSRRRTAAGVLAVVLGLVLTACGSSSSQSHQPSIVIPPPTTTAATTPSYYNSPINTSGASSSNDSDSSTASPTDLSSIGSFTVSSTGATVTTNLSVGQPLSNSAGTPPADVLTGCNWNYTATIAQSVYIHGQLSITYTGSLAEAINIPGPALVNLSDQLQYGGSIASYVGIQAPDGSWASCTSTWGYVLQPGSTVTADFWIEYLVLSNAHPSLTSADKEPLAIDFHAQDTDQASDPNAIIKVSGPGAAHCGDDKTPTLLLYSTPPYTFTTSDGSQSGSCTAG